VLKFPGTKAPAAVISASYKRKKVWDLGATSTVSTSTVAETYLPVVVFYQLALVDQA